MNRKILNRVAVAVVLLQLVLPSVTPAHLAANVASAYVSASQVGGEGGAYDYTNGTGWYEITYNIPPGNYSVSTSAFGYLGSTLSTTVSSLSDEKVLDFYLNRSALIVGKVAGVGGEPVVGADVTLYENATSRYIASTRTDSQGLYYFASDVPSGTYYVKVGFEFPFTSPAWNPYYGQNYTGLPTYPYLEAPYLPIGYVRSDSAAFVAVSGTTNYAPLVSLNSSAVIKGVVKDAVGNPVPNATVYASSLWGGHYITAVTDPSGGYRLSYDIVEGVYNVRPYAYGYVGPSVDVNTTGASVVVQDFVMNKSASVYGFVRRSGDGRPIANTYLNIYSVEGSDYGHVQSGADGYYSFGGGLTGGNHSIYVYVGSAYRGPYYVSLTDGAATRFDVDVDAFFVSGTVHMDNLTGPPVGYAQLYLTLNGVPSVSTIYGYGQSNGSFSIIVPVPEGYMGMPVTATLTAKNYNYNAAVRQLNLTMGTDASVDVALPSSATFGSAKIEGTVYGGVGPDLPSSMQWWHLTFANYTFTVGINSTSYVNYVYPYLLSKELYISARGPEGIAGQMTVFVPDSIMQGPFTIDSSYLPKPTIVSQVDNGTYTAVTFTFTQHNYNYFYLYSAAAVPEFPGWMVLGALGSAVFVAAMAERKLHLRTAAP